MSNDQSEKKIDDVEMTSRDMEKAISVEIGQSAKKEWYIKSLKVRADDINDSSKVLSTLEELRNGLKAKFGME